MVMDVDLYDSMPYRIADRKEIPGRLAADHLEILSICPLPNDINLVAATVEVQSPWAFYPSLTITKIGDRTGAWVPDYMTSATGVATFPLFSYASSAQYDLVYDFGSTFPDFISASPIFLQFAFSGSGTTFTSGTAPVYERFVEWDKGVYFKPLYINQLPNHYQMIYEVQFNGVCPCKVLCATPTGANYSGVDAKNIKLEACRKAVNSVEVISQPALSGDPISFVIEYQFSGGHSVKFENTIVAPLVPVTPEPSWVVDGCKIGVHYQSINNTTIHSGVKFRVEKYINNPENLFIVADWQTKTDYVYDLDLPIDTTVGYRTRFMGPFGDISEPSSWTIYTTS